MCLLATIAFSEKNNYKMRCLDTGMTFPTVVFKSSNDDTITKIYQELHNNDGSLSQS